MTTTPDPTGSAERPPADKNDLALLERVAYSIYSTNHDTADRPWSSVRHSAYDDAARPGREPRDEGGRGTELAQRGHGAPPGADGLVGAAGVEWGEFEPAIRRWERTFGRSAPLPAVIGRSGKRELNPRFVEWMMGLPAGWVTDVDIARNAMLKLLGNGVMPQQAALGLDLLGVPDLLRSRAAA